MNMILVDDEPLVLQQFSLECGDIEWVNVVGEFTNPYKAYEFVKYNEVDLAVLDIEMMGMSGLELSKELRKIDPRISIIFITGYDQYALEAFNQQAIGYVMKPFEKVEMLPLLQRVHILAKAKKQKVLINAFGRFDVFVNDHVVVFKNAKAKELLALCIDHNGGVVTMEEVIDKLWPNRSYDDRVKNLYRKAVVSLKSTLESLGLGGVFFNPRGCCYIDRNTCQCDYLDMLDGISNKYAGEYMFEYSWAEETNARLQNIYLDYLEN